MAAPRTLPRAAAFVASVSGADKVWAASRTLPEAELCVSGGGEGEEGAVKAWGDVD